MAIRIQILVTMLVFAGCTLDEDELSEDELSESVAAVEGSFADGAADDHAARFNPHRRNHVDRAALDRRACLNEIARRRARKMADEQCPGTADICHFDGLGNAINAECPFNWTAWGENVGVGQTEFGLWHAFLDSSPHHANIDSRNFNKFGVGAFRRSSDDLLFIVHVFAHN